MTEALWVGVVGGDGRVQAQNETNKSIPKSPRTATWFVFAVRVSSLTIAASTSCHRSDWLAALASVSGQGRGGVKPGEMLFEADVAVGRLIEFV
jgi:hypothetical protein